MTWSQEDQQEVIIIPVVKVCGGVEELSQLNYGRLADRRGLAQLLLGQRLHLFVQGTGVQTKRRFRHSEKVEKKSLVE